MKTKIILFVLLLLVSTALQLIAQNTNPIVSNVAFSISGTTVTVTYNVTDAEQDAFTIIMLVSSNNGSTWDYNYGTATGAIGAGVTEGTNKTIQWEYSGDYNPNFMVRIYANDETAGGSPCPGIPIVDYGGKTYNTIQIGTQCWLKENLDIGTRINSSQNSSNDGNIEKYCYNDLDANCATYGGFYKWNEAMQYVTTSGSKGICPDGWHIPTVAEFQTLSNSVGGNGNALKAVGQGSSFGFTNSTNISGFLALLAGISAVSGSYDLDYYGVFWSSTEYNSQLVYGMLLDITSTICNYYNSYYNVAWGFSIRCIKD